MRSHYVKRFNRAKWSDDPGGGNWLISSLLLVDGDIVADRKKIWWFRCRIFLVNSSYTSVIGERFRRWYRCLHPLVLFLPPYPSFDLHSRMLGTYPRETSSTLIQNLTPVTLKQRRAISNTLKVTIFDVVVEVKVLASCPSTGNLCCVDDQPYGREWLSVNGT